MRLPSRPMIAAALSAALLLLLFVRGVLPALSAIERDFPNYYAAARIVSEHGDSARLYDDAWFRRQLPRYGIAPEIDGKFSPFPPPTALLLLPLTGLDALNAQRVLTIINLIALLASVLWLARLLSWNVAEAAALVLLCGYALVNAIKFGQPYPIVSAACIGGYLAAQRGSSRACGLSLGWFVPIKYYPLVILAGLLWERPWRALAMAALAAAVVVGASIMLLGWDIHRQFIDTVMGQHLRGHLTRQSPYSASFQSLDALYQRLFVYDERENPRPWISLPALASWATPLTKAALLLAVAACLRRLRTLPPRVAGAWTIGVLGIAALLLAPATASYHFVLLWLPLALLLDGLLRTGQRLGAAILLGCYVGMGFFPYRFTVPFEGRAGWSALAFPRLWLLLAMLVVSLWAIPRRLEAAEQR